MAITFNNTNLQYAATYQALGYVTLGFASQTTITVHSGARPTSATIASSWSSYNANNSSFLALYWGSQIGGTLSYNSTNNFWALNPAILTQISATNTGTAAWAIIWGPSGTSYSTLSQFQTTLPTTSFVIVDVTSTSGTGIIRYGSTSLVQGVNTAIADMTLTMTSP